MNTNSNTVVSTASATQTNASDIIEGTGWTYSDAAAMAKECARDARFFPKNRSSKRKTLTASQRAARFLKQTGWTMADALSEAIECRRDRNLFGARVYAGI